MTILMVFFVANIPIAAAAAFLFLFARVSL
jgi:hypothetical protein